MPPDIYSQTFTADINEGFEDNSTDIGNYTLGPFHQRFIGRVTLAPLTNLTDETEFTICKFIKQLEIK